MNIDKLERANILAKDLIPKADNLLSMHRLTDERVGEYLNVLMKGDKEFNTKFMQLVNETKQRLQKEFDKL
ncbi:hypothetical protein [Segatella copri]|uniref:hypothetical protein n=1 Tax=Segatella copri TaxID=165179 RepID=UPI001C45B81E|nr:hypothetical protein [Segatella copri]MBW0024252.1 hypothetical protein [Segatella copri]